MKKAIIIAAVITAFIPGQVSAAVEGITSENWYEYEKPVKDEYGFNKGECSREYLEGEEFLYSAEYDHWNVDKIYDPDAVIIKKHEIVQDIITRWKV